MADSNKKEERVNFDDVFKNMNVKDINGASWTTIAKWCGIVLTGAFLIALVVSQPALLAVVAVGLGVVIGKKLLK